ncbi:hypothetical protein [Glycomyces tarimensis]
MNLRWIRALGDENAAPYELAAHPLGRLPVSAHELYSVRVRRSAAERGLPSAGKGVLVLESDLRGGIAEIDDARPFTPVVLIDGEPVATGFGRADIELEPGRHLVEVQSGASGAYAPVDIEAGASARLSSFVPQRLGTGAARLRRFALVPTRIVPPRPGRWFAMAMPCVGAAVGLFSTAVFDEDGIGKVLGLLIAAAMMTAGGVLFYWLARLIESAASALAELRLSGSLPVARHRPAPIRGGTWRPVDPRDGAEPEAERGTGVLRLTLTYEQAPVPAAEVGEVLDERAVRAASRRHRRFGEDYPPQARPWVEPPLVTVDDEPAPAIWGVNEYRLAAGRHRLRVEVPPPPEVLVGEATRITMSTEAGRHHEVVLDTSSTVALEAAAVIEMAPGHDGWELERYAGSFKDQSGSA